MGDSIEIHGARHHNLKNVSLSIPRGKFVVITGVSGSGKSTLAFDILFAEGQRRFLDVMNAYARQFVEQLERPEVDLVTGLPPTVSIEQRNSRGGGKSTVATVTEIHHFLRLLYSKLGTQYCPTCAIPVEAQTREHLTARVLKEVKQRGDLLLLAPVVRNRKGFHTEVGEWAAKHGYAEVRADGRMHATSDELRLDRFKEHDVEIVVGVVEAKPRKNSTAKPAAQLIDEALKLGHGTLFALGNDRKTTIHSIERACAQCGTSFPMLDPKMFSYNSSQGWCLKCRGFGELFYLPDTDRGARADAIEESWFDWQEGKREPCPECHGARLNPVSRSVRLLFGGTAGKSKRKSSLGDGAPTLDDIGQASVAAAREYFSTLKLEGRDAEIARDMLPEIRERLKFLGEVGLDYLQLGRGVTTLSGGEAQRIRLAAQLGSNLSGVLYVLDEPTIGLHSRDNEHLLRALELLKGRGNSLLVVEHDEETMRRADHVIDLGPGAGIHGGEVVATGTLEELARHPESVTGRFLREQPPHPARGERRAVDKKTAALVLHDASLNNLKDVTVRFPLGRLVVVTGVSGSGKSTLVRECLLPAVREALKSKVVRKGCRVAGHEGLRAVYEVDQSPVGRTPRSTPATYVGFFDTVRQLFAQTPEARMRGWTASRFSFNSAQGRCPACEGAGTIKLEMNFLPPAYVTCEDCRGTRFDAETLDILYKGLSIAQVMNLGIDEALLHFESVPKMRLPLQALSDTGLGYLKLGQVSPTLSGGEAQRMKLVTHLIEGFRNNANTRRFEGQRNLFILEEPTIGLHMADVRRLVEVLQRLIDAGHSVVVIEHNLDLIAEADWVIDMGPEAGAAGGAVVVEGTPEEVARCAKSHTGRFLKSHLRARPKS